MSAESLRPQLRPVNPNLWNDGAFNQLSPKAQHLFLYILTHPHLTSLGALRGRAEWLGQERGWPLVTARRAALELIVRGLIEEDETQCFVYIKRYLRLIPPASPEAIREWRIDFDRLPACARRTEVLDRARQVATELGEAFSREFSRLFDAECPAAGCPDGALLKPGESIAEPLFGDFYQQVAADADPLELQNVSRHGGLERRRTPSAAWTASRATRATSEPRAEPVRPVAPPAAPSQSQPSRPPPSEGPAPRADPSPEAEASPATQPRGRNGRFLPRGTPMPGAARIVKQPPPPDPPQALCRAGIIECTVRAEADRLPRGPDEAWICRQFLHDVINARVSAYRNVSFRVRLSDPDP